MSSSIGEQFWKPKNTAVLFSDLAFSISLKLLPWKIRSELFKKKSNLFFRFSKDKKKLTQLEKEIFEHEKSVAICLNLSEKSFKYYSKHKPPAKCLICNSIDVSKLPYYYDKHSCGGDFNVNIKRMGQAIFYTNITYSADGSSVVEKKPFNFWKLGKIIKNIKSFSAIVFKITKL